MSEHNFPENLAAIDLGSNSFHLVVARIQDDGQLKIVDRMKDMVRLASGLDYSNKLVESVRERALHSLSRFGQRLHDLPPEAVRALGTNTLRQARNAGAFLLDAEKALGFPIEIISGVEEARLIYLGVAHSIAANGARRLVVDIGGGSTEIIVGEGVQPIQLDSLYMGCVSMSNRFFAKGKITKARFEQATLVAQMELEPIELEYKALGWTDAVGASGTIRSVQKVVSAMGWSEFGISYDSLLKLRAALLEAGRVSELGLAGLNEDRAPVFPGGVAILLALFQSLRIDHMRVSDGALREGALYDLIGRIEHEDVREKTVSYLEQLYKVDLEQGQMVAQTAIAIWEQVKQQWSLQEEELKNYLHWAARLHEMGLTIAHSGYHKHGAYILANADLTGFSRRAQRIVSALVRGHRRKYPAEVFKDLPVDQAQPAQYLCIILRIAALMHRSRRKLTLPVLFMETGPQKLHLRFPPQWLDEHPLSCADLYQEKEYMKTIKFDFDFN